MQNRNNLSIHIYKYICTVIGAIILLSLHGCMSTNLTPLALTTNPTDTGLGQQLLLVTLTTRNNYHPAYQPNVQTVTIRNLDTHQDMEFNAGQPCAVVNGYNKYLLSFSLIAGHYEFENADGYSAGYSATNHIKGIFTIPVHTRFTVGQDGIVYLGNVNATLQNATNVVQLPAGPSTPLFDQTVTGFSSGTFVITFNDNFAEDMTDFESNYSGLVDQDVEKNLLSY